MSEQRATTETDCICGWAENRTRSCPVHPPSAETTAHIGAVLIHDERQRQIDKGYSIQHDFAHGSQDLMRAARCYEVPNNRPGVPQGWPWEDASWKPRDIVRNLVRAGALYQAALDVASPHGYDRDQAKAGLWRCRKALSEIYSVRFDLTSPPGQATPGVAS